MKLLHVVKELKYGNSVKQVGGIKLFRFYSKIDKYKKEKEAEAIKKIKELVDSGYENLGNPFFFKELVERIKRHPDFKDDFEFLDKLDELAEYLPEFKAPLPYPISVHLQHVNGRWRLTPYTIYAPTEAQIEHQIAFAQAMGKIAGTKGLPMKKVAKVLKEVKKSSKKKKRKIKYDRLKVALRR